MKSRSISFAAALFCLGLPAFADLAAVKAEPNLERRSERALLFANEALTSARQEYDEGKSEQFETSLRNVEQASELSIHSLEQTGKSARRSPKFYKRAELALRSLLRRIESLRQEVSVDDRARVETLKAKVDTIHDRLVQDLMEKKK